jgi:cytochrome P450
MPTIEKEQLFQSYDWARPLRAAGPVHHDERQGVWLVVRHAEARRVLRDHQAFSSDTSPLHGGRGPHDPPPSLLDIDPPDHRRLRGLVSQAFTPQAIAQLEPRIASIVADLLDRAPSRGALDIVADLAVPLPVTVISEMLGIPAHRSDDFKRWSDAFVIAEGGPPGPRPPELLREVDAMRAYLREAIEERRRHPGEDLIGRLVAAEMDNGRLTGDEVLAFCTLLLVAGNVTTTNLIANSVLCFDRFPEALDLVRSRPQLLPGAIEEVLRYLPPIQQSTPRLAREDVVLGGRHIARNSLVLPVMASANRDDLVFTEPDRFDVSRDPNPHLGFGHGVHFCLGAPLARLEARVALSVMLERLDGAWQVPERVIEIEPPPTFLLGPRRLSVTWGSAPA